MNQSLTDTTSPRREQKLRQQLKEAGYPVDVDKVELKVVWYDDESGRVTFRKAVHHSSLDFRRVTSSMHYALGRGNIQVQPERVCREIGLKS